MPGSRELIRIQIETLFTLDERGRLVRVNEPEGKPAPRFFIGRTREGSEWRVRHDVAPELVRELEAACHEEDEGDELLQPPYGAERYESILGRDAPVVRRWAGPVYRFPDDLAYESSAVAITERNADVLGAHLSAWLDDPALLQPMVGVVVDDDAVSICASVRSSSTAHEAGVETAPAFRGRGYGAQAVAAWARAVRDRDRIPLYSTSWENHASRALAARLGLVRFGTDLHIT